MSNESTYGRRPVVLAEVTQPRCSRRFGEGCNPEWVPATDVRQLLGSSEDFTLATGIWSPVGAGTGSVAVVTPDAGESPTGTDNATRLQLDLNGGTTSGDRSDLRYNPFVSVTGQPYVFSIWMKSFDGTPYDVQIVLNGSADEPPLSVKTVTGEWQRFWVKDDVAVDDNRDPIIRLRGGEGTSDSADILIWGAQVEDGLSPTDYQLAIAGDVFERKTPKCYNTYWTCADRPRYLEEGSIAWRFSRPGDDVGWLYEQTDENNFKTNAIPLLNSASHTSTRINPGSARTGESPLGRRATARVDLVDGVWDDHVGDFYLADRPEQERPAGFFSLLKARNPFYPGWTVAIYEGYEGQALSAMQKRLFDVEQLTGPDSSGAFTIVARDPLDVLRSRNTKYPPVSRIEIRGKVSDSATSIPVTCLAAELTADYGNSGSTRYAVIGSEIISYTGFTGTEPELTLTGVERGVLGSEPEAHDNEEAVQRGAYHIRQRLYEVAKYILKSHTAISNTYIDDAQWDAEGGTYLTTLTATTFIGEPTAVENIIGELGRDGLFYVWWDERTQKIPLLAVRPPRGVPDNWNDGDNIAGFSKVTKIDDRMTRVTLYFGVRDWLEGLEEPTNYRNRRIRIDTEVESEVATGGKIVDNTIFSRWVRTFSNALLVSASLLLRYRLPPEYITLEMDAKDRDVQIGDVIDLTTRYLLDSEGNFGESRWQVIGIEEPDPGSKIRVELQTYQFVGRFAFIAPNDAPVYSAATEAQRFESCFLAGADDKMPNGDEPYLIQ